MSHEDVSGSVSSSEGLTWGTLEHEAIALSLASAGMRLYMGQPHLFKISGGGVNSCTEKK